MRPYQTSLVTAAAPHKGRLDTAESEVLSVT